MRALEVSIAALLLATSVPSWAQAKRKIIIDEDAAGPGSTDQRAILVLVQSPRTEVLGITVVTGDDWLKSEVAHALRTLELIGRTDVPVVPGATAPLVRRKDDTERWEKQYGPVEWLGAWTPKYYHPPDKVWTPEGTPATQPASEDAAHFLVRMVHKYPHEVTIYAGGPMTNIALAAALDPEFATLAKELVFMGASFDPQTKDPDIAAHPRREFNLWFDPEAAHIVFSQPWSKIVCTPVDVSIKTHLTQTLLDRLKPSTSAAAMYVVKYTNLEYEKYLWDELAAAAWLDPSIITKTERRSMDVDIDHGRSYGDTVTDRDKTAFEPRKVDVQVDVDAEKFYRTFVELVSARPR